MYFTNYSPSYTPYQKRRVLVSDKVNTNYFSCFYLFRNKAFRLVSKKKVYLF